MSAWVVEIGIWLRTGAWPGDADPIDAIPDLGTRPLAIIYGTADDSDLPDRNAKVLFSAAEAAGVPVEIHACPGGTHGKGSPTIESRARPAGSTGCGVDVG